MLILSAFTISGLIPVFRDLAYTNIEQHLPSQELLAATSAGVLSQAIEAAATPTSIWSGLLSQTPVPQTTPLPDPIPTSLDGTYAISDPSLPQWWTCRRCADYRPAGGIWKLHFDRGVMRIYYEVTGWKSLASYTVSGGRLILFNDPYCPEDVGEYTWTLAGDNLSLQVIDDPCSIRLRGENLSRQTWLSCAPPDVRAATSGHWDKPLGCEPNPSGFQSIDTSGLPFTVNVYGGDARKLTKPPDHILYTNGDSDSMQAGIRLEYSESSLPYGLNRILWQAGDWAQADISLPLAAMGIQFFGDHTIGWARLLFDGMEIWRGDTSAIWSSLGYYGGYIEVSGFEPGAHNLRVERLAVDSRPVKIMFFGFSGPIGVTSESPD